MQRIHSRASSGMNDIQTLFRPAPLSKALIDSCRLFDMILTHRWSLKSFPLNNVITSVASKSNLSPFLTLPGEMAATSGSTMTRQSSKLVSPMMGWPVKGKDTISGPRLLEFWNLSNMSILGSCWTSWWVTLRKPIPSLPKGRCQTGQRRELVCCLEFHSAK